MYLFSILAWPKQNIGSLQTAIKRIKLFKSKSKHNIIIEGKKLKKTDQQSKRLVRRCVLKSTERISVQRSEVTPSTASSWTLRPDGLRHRPGWEERRVQGGTSVCDYFKRSKKILNWTVDCTGRRGREARMGGVPLLWLGQNTSGSDLHHLETNEGRLTPE